MDSTTTAAFSKCHNVLKGGEKNGPKRCFCSLLLRCLRTRSASRARLFLGRGLDRPPPPVGLLPRRSLTAASLHSEMSGGGEAANWPGISAEHRLDGGAAERRTERRLTFCHFSALPPPPPCFFFRFCQRGRSRIVNSRSPSSPTTPHRAGWF